MSTTLELCGGRSQCQGVISHACNCNNPVVYLCKDCILDHLAHPTAHVFLTLEQARALTLNPLAVDTFCEGLLKYVRLTNSINQYLDQIGKFKESVKSLRLEAIALIEQECTAKLEELNLLENRARFILDLIQQKTGRFIDSEDELLKKYELNGLKGVIEDYSDCLIIHHQLIKDSIHNMITINSQRSTQETTNHTAEIASLIDNKSLYFTKCKSNELLQYNHESNTVATIDLKDSLVRSFHRSSCSLLPDGNVMIVGCSIPQSGDTYRFSPTTGKCTQLKGLNHPRGSVNLLCNDRYLYAFGGNSKGRGSRKAEKMEWGGNGWHNLADMKESRYYFGSYFREGKIYLIGGTDNSTVEYYDVNTNTFALMPGVSVPMGANLVATYDDKIYMLVHRELMVYSNEFENIETEFEVLDNSITNLSTLITIGNEMVFHCLSNKAILRLDPQKCEIKLLKEL
jgi:hypothetical protein